MSETKFQHGDFCWHEIGTRDVGASKAFYGGLLGWTVEESREDGSTERVPIAARHVCFLLRRFKRFRDDVTRPYVRALEARRIPHVLVGGRSFHEREEVETRGDEQRRSHAAADVERGEAARNGGEAIALLDPELGEAVHPGNSVCTSRGGGEHWEFVDHRRNPLGRHLDAVE